ncbi:hypothetical protein ABT382_29985 [Streptomyces pharetrae]
MPSELDPRKAKDFVTLSFVEANATPPCSGRRSARRRRSPGQ